MKILLSFIYLFVTQTFAQKSSQQLDLNLKLPPYQPSQSDINLIMEQAQGKLNGHQKSVTSRNCQIETPIESKIQLDGSYVCFVPPEKTFSQKMFDPADKVTHRAVSTNDGNIFKVPSEDDPLVNKSNDTGFTVGGHASYSRSNLERNWTLEFDSKLFTAYTTGPNGEQKTAEGRYYLDTFEVSRIQFTAQDNTYSKNLKPMLQLGLKHNSTNGRGFGSKSQDFVHDSLDRYEKLRYQRVKGGYTRITAEAKAGGQKIFEADISNIHCLAAGTALAGIDSRGQPLLNTQLEASISTGRLGNRNQSTPLFLVKLLQDRQRTGREKSREERLVVGSYILAKKNISVFLGLGTGRYVENITSEKFKDYEEPLQFLLLEVNH